MPTYSLHDSLFWDSPHKAVPEKAGYGAECGAECAIEYLGIVQHAVRYDRRVLVVSWDTVDGPCKRVFDNVRVEYKRTLLELPIGHLWFNDGGT